MVRTWMMDSSKYCCAILSLHDTTCSSTLGSTVPRYLHRSVTSRRAAASAASAASDARDASAAHSLRDALQLAEAHEVHAHKNAQVQTLRLALVAVPHCALLAAHNVRAQSRGGGREAEGARRRARGEGRT